MKYIVVNERQEPQTLIQTSDLKYFKLKDVKPGQILVIGTRAHVFGTLRGALHAIERTEKYAQAHAWRRQEYAIVPVED